MQDTDKITQSVFQNNYNSTSRLRELNICFLEQNAYEHE